MPLFLRVGALMLFVLGVGYYLYVHSPAKGINENVNEDVKTIAQNPLPPVTRDDWGVIVGAPYAVFNGYAVNDFTPETAEDNGLSYGWKIHNRQDLIRQLFWLSMGGPTRVFYDMRSELAGMPKNEFDKLLANIEQGQLDKTKKQEIVWQYNMMYHNTHNIKNVNYWVWDYVRFSMLCLEGTRLKYITEAEAKAWTRMLAPRLRATFHGWDDLWHNFLIARWFWSAQDKLWMQKQSELVDIIDNLLKEPSSPAISIDWNTPLSSIDTCSFVEAVASLQLKDENGVIIGVDELNNIIQSHLNITEPK